MMKRAPFRHNSKLSSEANELITLAEQLAEAASGAGSQLERRFWQTRIAERILRLLVRGDDRPLSAALDKLSQTPSAAYEALADMIEAQVECSRLQTESGEKEVLLFLVPIYAWSRAGIPTCAIPAAAQNAILTLLYSQVFVPDTHVAIADHLLSPDHLTGGYVELAALANQLFAQSIKGKNLLIDPSQLRETAPFISDTRFILGAVAMPPGSPPWRWLLAEGNAKALADEAERKWQIATRPIISALLPACAFEIGRPMAFFSGSRLAERKARIYSVRASVDFMQLQFGVAAAAVTAVLGHFVDEDLEEWRIGFSLDGGNTIVHGMIWPLMDDPDPEQADLVGDIGQDDSVIQIEKLLRDAGLLGQEQVVIHRQRFTMEFCDDCGSPLYPNKAGETVHVDVPAESDGPTVFH